MNTGTIYRLNETQCEVVIQPETPERINQAKEALGDNGFRVDSAQVLGNFAVKLDEEKSIVALKRIVIGEIIEVRTSIS